MPDPHLSSGDSVKLAWWARFRTTAHRCPLPLDDGTGRIRSRLTESVKADESAVVNKPKRSVAIGFCMRNFDVSEATPAWLGIAQ